jgi:hypothetical protein
MRPIEPSSFPMRLINLLLGIAAALLAAAAIGAIWSLVGLVGAGRAAWVAPLAAVALAWLLRFNNHPPGSVRAIVAAMLLVLTAAHANYLMAAGFIAGQMGLELVDALRIIGVDMALAVTRAHTDAGDVLAYSVALALAVAMGLRQPGEATGRRPVRRTKG